MNLHFKLEGNWYADEYAHGTFSSLNPKKLVKAYIAIKDKIHSDNTWVYLTQDGEGVGNCNPVFFDAHFFRRPQSNIKKLAKLVNEAYAARMNAKYADGTLLYSPGLNRVLVVEGQLKAWNGSLVWKVRILNDEHDDRPYRADVGYLKRWRPLKSTDKFSEVE